MGDATKTAGETTMTPVYLIHLTLAVDDVAALWTAAAAVAMSAPGMTVDDVIETIGPRDDPSIEDCIAMLAEPGRYEGCAVTAMACTLVPKAVASGRSAAPDPVVATAPENREWQSGRIQLSSRSTLPAASR